MTTCTDVEFWLAVLEMRGAKWRHKGRCREKCDCIGMPFVAAWSKGLDVEDFRGYRRGPDPDVLNREVAKRCQRRDWREYLLVGRLLVLKPAGRDMHFGVMGPDGQAAKIDTRFVIEPIDPASVSSVWLVRGVLPTVTL